MCNSILYDNKFSNFKYPTIALENIDLDSRNPRIVTPTRLTSQDDMLQYLFEHEDLGNFIKKIAREGKNDGAERPYVVKEGKGYTVIEGNTRIAAYQVLAGLLKPPAKFSNSIPPISESSKALLLNVDCSLAPNRDALLPIMATAHFGQGDKSKWGYLGSRKKVFDEWKGGKNVADLADAFERNEGQIREHILEYLLYLEALKLNWTVAEKDKLQSPGVKFNPPVRFLQTSGHKERLGVKYDGTNLEIQFADREAKNKFKHMLKKLVIDPVPGLGATASWDQVFSDYVTAATSGASDQNPGGTAGGANPASGQPGGAATSSGSGAASHGSGGGSGTQASGSAGSSGTKLKAGTLFSYPVSMNNGLIKQLIQEAKELNCKKFPASGTFLLRSIVEAILKQIIDDNKANSNGARLSLENCISICKGSTVKLDSSDKKILGEFDKSHVNYLNLGAHGNVIPNYDRLCGARDCIDQFVKKHV